LYFLNKAKKRKNWERESNFSEIPADQLPPPNAFMDHAFRSAFSVRDEHVYTNVEREGEQLYSRNARTLALFRDGAIDSIAPRGMRFRDYSALAERHFASDVIARVS